MDWTGTTMDDLIPMAEALRKIQAQCNSYDGQGTRNAFLAASSSAWGDIGSAMTRVIAEWYCAAQGVGEYAARRMAERVVEEVYDNGESVSYNMRLLAEGTIQWHSGRYV
jgi:hypothetical protein